jgi:hypothetical protein
MNVLPPPSSIMWFMEMSRIPSNAESQTRRPESSVTLLYKPLDLNNNKTSSPVKAQEFYG